MAEPRSHRLRVAEVIEQTSDAVSVVLTVPPELAELYAYRPGQFLTLGIPGPRGASLARCYSLSSAPHEGSRLTVTVKRVDEGQGSNWICDNAVAGMELETLPPAGTFTPRSLDDDMMLVAAGSGITPVMSIIRAALAGGSGRLTLLYANRDENSVIFAAELRAMVAEHPDRLVVLHWLQSVQGLPSRPLLAELARPYTDREFFLCGPLPFMDATSHALRDLGVPRKRVHIERFVSLEASPFAPVLPGTSGSGGPDRGGFEGAGPSVAAGAPQGAEPAAGAGATTSTVEVELDGERRTLAWPAGVVLLDLLRDAGLDAPFSCREGACSACACRVTDGQVTMRRNQVLDQTDLDDGYVLACQALPVSDSVTVTYD